MAHVKWTNRPTGGESGSDPILVMAFNGWNDAGDAASRAVEHLWEAWSAEEVATLDPEDFLDFTVVRPVVRVEGGVVEELTWPTTRFGVCGADTGGRSVVLAIGPEPAMRWREYCATVLSVAEALGCSMVVTVGAMVSDVPHTRPAPLYLNSHDPALTASLAGIPSEYTGPTGIPAVLHHEAHTAGFDALSLWSAVPAYAGGAPSPRACAALVEGVAAVVGRPVPTEEILEAVQGYVEELDALCAEDEETAEYVEHLERLHDENTVQRTGAGDLVEEVERFLRDQG